MYNQICSLWGAMQGSRENCSKNKESVALLAGAMLMLFHGSFFSFFATAVPSLMVAQWMFHHRVGEALTFVTALTLSLGSAVLIGLLAAIFQSVLVRRTRKTAVAWVVLACHVALFSMMIIGALTDT